MEEAVCIWLGVGVVLALGSAFWSGWTGDWDPSGGVLIALMWPLFAIGLIVMGPFWLAYKAGDRIQRALSAKAEGQS